MLLAIAIVLIAWMIFYVLWMRNWLIRQPWAWSRALYRWIEPIERNLWDKSETILWSRFLIVLGALPPLLDGLGVLNTPELLAVVPDKYRTYVPLIFTVLGIVSEFLRRSTTKPLAVVSLPDDAPPAVTQAVAYAEAAKETAVAAVASAKQAGTL